MSGYEIRNIRSDDFETLCQLEVDIFGSLGYALLGPNYLRVCTNFYADSSFIAFQGGRPVAYLLAFLKERESYCTRLGVVPDLRGSHVTMRLIAEYIHMLLGRGIDSCWFTVKPANTHARALYQRIGAVEDGKLHGFLTPGDELLVQRLGKQAMEQLDQRRAAAV